MAADRRARRRTPAPAARSERGSRPARPARRRRLESAAETGPPRRRSDLLARVLVAIPAAILAIVFVDLGDGLGPPDDRHRLRLPV